MVEPVPLLQCQGGDQSRGYSLEEGKHGPPSHQPEDQTDYRKRTRKWYAALALDKLCLFRSAVVFFAYISQRCFFCGFYLQILYLLKDIGFDMSTHFFWDQFCSNNWEDAKLMNLSLTSLTMLIHIIFKLGSYCVKVKFVLKTRILNLNGDYHWIFWLKLLIWCVFMLFLAILFDDLFWRSSYLVCMISCQLHLHILIIFSSVKNFIICMRLMSSYHGNLKLALPHFLAVPGGSVW